MTSTGKTDDINTVNQTSPTCMTATSSTAKENPSDTSQIRSEDATKEKPEYLFNQSSQDCLSVLNSKGPEDATIGVASYTGNVNQQWFISNGQWQWGGNRSFCLTPDWSNNGLRLAPCSDVNTTWVLDEKGLFVNGSYVMGVTLKKGKETKVMMFPKHNATDERWWKLSYLKSCVNCKVYPILGTDDKVYEQECARDIVNMCCPLSESLPQGGDVAHYPGAVSVTTPRINGFCSLEVATLKHPKNIRMRTPEDWQATDMYVAAGDVFKILLPDTFTKEQAGQIKVQVGAHCDHLDPFSPYLENGILKRMPLICDEFNLSPGENNFRSKAGGNLIFKYNGEESFKVKAEIRNVVETPYYILGKTKISDWNRMKVIDTPFSVLESNRVVLVVPTSKAKVILDPASLLQLYDDIIKELDELAGFSENDPPPQGKQWLVDDIQISVGSAHAGFPVMFDNQYYDLTSTITPHHWVIWHEIGHNYQQGPFWSNAYGIETTVNLFSLYIEEKVKANDRLEVEGQYVSTASAVDNGLTFEKADCWQKLVFLMEIKHSFPNQGWDMYRHLNIATRALSEEEANSLKYSRQKQYDHVYKTLSRYLGTDLLPHYQRWSLPISQQVQKEIESLKLPKSPKNLSVKYFPNNIVDKRKQIRSVANYY